MCGGGAHPCVMSVSFFSVSNTELVLSHVERNKEEQILKITPQQQQRVAVRKSVLGHESGNSCLVPWINLKLSLALD